MQRIKSRVSVVGMVIVLAVATQLLAVSSSSAKPLAVAEPQGQEAAGDWLTAALHWLGRVLAGDVAQTAQDTAGGDAQPYTGSCIDPQGIKPWCQ